MTMIHHLPLFGIAALLLCLAATGDAGAKKKETGFLFRSIESGGREYKYVTYVPRDYSGKKKWPLLVFLNGAGECGTDGSKQISVGLAPAIMTRPDQWPFVVLFPQKPDVKDAWERHDDAVMAMIEKAKSNYKIDDERIYLTGLSQGGHGTWAIGASHPDLWAAIAPVCGYGDPAVIAKPLKSMPIWCFHGDADTAVNVQQSEAMVEAMVEAIQKEGGSPKLTIYPGVGHNSWDKAYRDEGLGEWLLQFKAIKTKKGS